jgi:rRNA maturation protein Nop10
MDKEKKAEDDFPYFATCTHCGMQTGFSLKQLECDEPLKCPACGAPLKIATPPKRPPKKKEKRSSDYYLLHAERAENEPPLDKKYNIAANIVAIFFYASVVIFFIFMWLITNC